MTRQGDRHLGKPNAALIMLPTVSIIPATLDAADEGRRDGPRHTAAGDSTDE